MPVGYQRNYHVFSRQMSHQFSTWSDFTFRPRIIHVFYTSNIHVTNITWKTRGYLVVGVPVGYQRNYHVFSRQMSHQFSTWSDFTFRPRIIHVFYTSNIHVTNITWNTRGYLVVGVPVGYQRNYHVFSRQMSHQFSTWSDFTFRPRIIHVFYTSNIHVTNITWKTRGYLVVGVPVGYQRNYHVFSRQMSHQFSTWSDFTFRPRIIHVFYTSNIHVTNITWKTRGYLVVGVPVGYQRNYHVFSRQMSHQFSTWSDFTFRPRIIHVFYTSNIHVTNITWKTRGYLVVPPVHRIATNKTRVFHVVCLLGNYFTQSWICLPLEVS